MFGPWTLIFLDISNLAFFTVLAFRHRVFRTTASVLQKRESQIFHSLEVAHVVTLMHFWFFSAFPRWINLLDKIKSGEKLKACDPFLVTLLDHIRHHSHWSRGSRRWWRWFTRQRTSTFVHLTVERHCDLVAALVHWWLFDFVCLALFYMFTSKHAKPLWNSETISFSGKILVLFASSQTIAWWSYPMVTRATLCISSKWHVSVSMEAISPAHQHQRT